MTNDITFGEMLQIYRKRKKLTIAELAKMVDVSEAKISNYEHNKSIPSAKNFNKIVNAIDAPAGNLLAKLKESQGRMGFISFD